MVRGKKCVVPICLNRYKDINNKIFIHVPRDLDIKKKWRKALNITEINSNHIICEDHFNLDKDAANWMYYKLMGKRIILKPGIIPHKYIENPPPSNLPSILSESEKKRKLNFLGNRGCGSVNRLKKDLMKRIFNEASPDQNIQIEVASPSDLFQVYQLYEGIICPVEFQVNCSDEVEAHNISTNKEIITFEEENMVDKSHTLSFKTHVGSNITSSPLSPKISEIMDIKQEIGLTSDENEQQYCSIEEMQKEDIHIYSLSVATMNSTENEVYIKKEIDSEQEDDGNHLNFDPKLNEVSDNLDDEYDIFSKHIATQLRQLPRITSLELKEKIQKLVSNETQYLQSDSKEILSWIKTEKE